MRHRLRRYWDNRTNQWGWWLLFDDWFDFAFRSTSSSRVLFTSSQVFSASRSVHSFLRQVERVIMVWLFTLEVAEKLALLGLCIVRLTVFRHLLFPAPWRWCQHSFHFFICFVNLHWHLYNFSLRLFGLQSGFLFDKGCLYCLNRLRKTWVSRFLRSARAHNDIVSINFGRILVIARTCRQRTQHNILVQVSFNKWLELALFDTFDWSYNFQRLIGWLTVFRNSLLHWSMVLLIAL